MRALIAMLVALAVLAGSALAVAGTVDNEAAAFRARAAKTLAAEQEDGCGCTADVRAKDRLASRNTAKQDAAN